MASIILSKIGVIWYAYVPEPSTAKMGRKLESSTSATLAGAANNGESTSQNVNNLRPFTRRKRNCSKEQIPHYILIMWNCLAEVES
ncbi:hypothetical protein OUZ56_012008 [Daphnia magna]|uniref:Uncharacterized protein n=1 Tax=Daphnia magna TaxID=35525 RepID=A0ABQ9Z1S1_9CRUS|nr:hypothetical protein OUZ56_012008 [Daphnia magna]